MLFCTFGGGVIAHLSLLRPAAALCCARQEQYWQRGFKEVITPNIYNVKLWERSGHWQNYQVRWRRWPDEPVVG